jgi:His Kinase A (phospho-acceptor) domain
LRFDDRLETSMRFAGDNSVDPLVRWRQLIDILSQNPKNFSTDQIALCLLEARRLLPAVPKEERLASVKSLTGRIRSAPLVQFLAADVPDVASAAISGARLSDSEWADIIPALPVRARGFLRNRSDLEPLTKKTLLIWSSVDFVLTDVSANRVSVPDPAPASLREKLHAGVQIRDIVERIERLRRDRENVPEDVDSLINLGGIHKDQSTSIISEIRFETDELGTIIWAEGVPRGAIVGVTVAEPAFDSSPGPDANGASAFRQRMPIENARMRLCGAPNIEGDWRINAAPFFEPSSGRFRGYRGILRRPNAAESPQIVQNRTDSGDQMQQLVHELRTPLGAIIGFSEIIEQQLFGPVSAEYRSLASNILVDAKRLLAGFDDLSMAARVESGRFETSPGTTKCNWLVNKIAERLQGLTESLSINLNLSTADPVRPFAIEHDLSERLFSRLLSAVIIGCDAGEELRGRFRTELGIRAQNSFTLSLPLKLKDLNEAELLGSVPNETDGEIDAPLLGLGFSLRLVRNLARSVRGDLRFQKECLILMLPADQESGLHQSGEERD